jgi:hypothetical protein
MFINVGFPAPFSPKRTWISPFSKSKFTLSLATVPGNTLVMFFISTTFAKRDYTFLSSNKYDCEYSRIKLIYHPPHHKQA